MICNRSKSWRNPKRDRPRFFIATTRRSADNSVSFHGLSNPSGVWNVIVVSLFSRRDLSHCSNLYLNCSFLMGVRNSARNVVKGTPVLHKWHYDKQRGYSIRSIPSNNKNFQNLEKNSLFLYCFENLYVVRNIDFLKTAFVFYIGKKKICN